MYRYRNRAQVTMELAMAIVGVVILFLGCINTFLWLNRVMASRQHLYDESREEASSRHSRSTPDERQVDEDWLPRLQMLD